MISTSILKKTCVDLQATATFAGLELWREIYPTPAIHWISSQSSMIIQVADLGGQVVNSSGSVRRDQFTLGVGLFIVSKKDYGSRSSEELQDEKAGILVYSKVIVDTLQDNFLGSLLVRPWILSSWSAVQLLDPKVGEIGRASCRERV